jgi:peptide/nickel transport system permease protein
MGLQRYVVRRLLQLVFTYWVFLTLLFGIFRLAPGDPTSMYQLDGLSPEARQQILERLGLNDPLHVQYYRFMVDFLTGNWGDSFRYGEPVVDILVLKFWNTVLLMGPAFLLAFAIGILLGAFLGWVRGTKKEKIGLIGTLFARSSPEFWIGILVLIVFTFQLGWFPSGGIRSPGANPASFWGRYLAWDFLHHLALPLLTGVIFYMATPTLLMRSSMINVLNSDFVEMKKAEGIPEYIILYKHAARNSILPVTTVVAIVIGLTIGGSLVIETVFNWPGMGREMVQSVTYNDYNVSQAIFFLMGSVVIFMNLVADIAYVYLDPRVRFDEQ